MFKKTLLAFLLFPIFLACKTAKVNSVVYKTPILKIEKLTDRVYIHESYLEYEGNKVGCNGLIYKKGKEVVILDTPNYDETAEELIRWVENELNAKIIAVVASHFHTDAYGGLAIFRDHGIPTYASEKTLEFADAKDNVPLQFSFKGESIFMNGAVITKHFGEGHTKDICVSYIKDEGILFGACLVKKLNTGKGYLGDANIDAWPGTVERVKTAYPNAKIVVPGHGEHGGIELLDYTIKMFTK